MIQEKKKKKKPKDLNARDFGTPESRNKRVMAVIDGQLRGCEMLIDYYLHRMWIDERQFLAAQKIALYFEYLGGLRHSRLKLEDAHGADILDEDEENAIEKIRRKYFAAQRAIRHTSLQVVLNVCCYEKDISKSPKLMCDLKDGLNDLIKHFSL